MYLNRSGKPFSSIRSYCEWWGPTTGVPAVRCVGETTGLRLHDFAWWRSQFSGQCGVTRILFPQTCSSFCRLGLLPVYGFLTLEWWHTVTWTWCVCVKEALSKDSVHFVCTVIPLCRQILWIWHNSAANKYIIPAFCLVRGILSSSVAQTLWCVMSWYVWNIAESLYHVIVDGVESYHKLLCDSPPEHQVGGSRALPSDDDCHISSFHLKWKKTKDHKSTLGTCRNADWCLRYTNSEVWGWAALGKDI